MPLYDTRVWSFSLLTVVGEVIGNESSDQLLLVLDGRDLLRTRVLTPCPGICNFAWSLQQSQG
jgi:hypothetical protein